MCKKSLLMMLLMALLVPWAANAQSLFTEDFEDGSMPTGWTTDGPGTWSVGTGDYSSSTGAGHGTYNAKITHNTTGNVTKLITPEIDLSTVTSAELSFMHVQRSWAGDIDQLRVYYRTSSNGSWTQIAEYTSAFATWTTEEGIALPNLSSTYQIAFEHTDKYGYGVGVDNIVIAQPASCVKPTGLAATPNGQSATLTWTSDASSFHVAYSADGTANPDDLTYTTVTTNSYTKDNLALDADHYFWVRANCSGTDQSDWAGPVSVHIGYCVPAPTSVDGNGISNVTFGIDDYVVNNETPKATYADYSNLVGAVRAGVEATIAITFKTSYTYNTYVWVDLDNSLSFDADEVVCYGESTSSNPTTLTLNFTIPADQTLGDFRLRIGSADSGLGSDPTTANPCYTGAYGCFQDYTLRVLEAPSCLPPTGLTVSDVTARTANISWTSDGNAWQIGYSNDNFATEQYVDVTETSYTLTGLAPETAYQVRVQNNCGGGTYSLFTNPVSFTTPVACPAPTVAVSNITANTADVSCTNTEATEFNVQLINPNTTPADTTLFENVAMPYTLTGLTDNTSYKVRVQALCGGEDGESAWSNGTSFMTAEICPDGMVCIGSGTATNGYLPTYTYYNYSLTQQIYTAAEIGGAGAIMSIDFYSTATERTRNLDIYMVMTDKASFASNTDYIAVTASDLVYSGNVTFVQNDWTTIQLNTPFAYADDTQNVALIVHDKTGGYVNSPSFRVFDATNMALYAYNDNYDYDPSTPGTYSNGTYTFTKANVKNRVRLVMGEIVDCDMPTNLAVSDITMQTANLTWTAGGSETAWQVCINGDEANLIDVTNNAYQMTGLTPATIYTVKVRANCGNGQSYWTPEISFNTAICDAANQCEISYEFSVGSSYTTWHSATIDVVDVETNLVLATLTYDAEAPTGTVTVCDGREIKFVYNLATPEFYNSYNAFSFTDVNGEEIFSGTGNSSWTESTVLYTYTVSCIVTNCKRPTNLAVSEIGNHSAKLSWHENGEATEWIVAYTTDGETFTEVSATDTITTVTGLAAETLYGVKVRPVCDVDDRWSDMIGFTTDVACPKPTNLSVTPYPYTANVEWSGFAEAYEIEWAEMPASESKDPYSEDGWYYYDNGTYQGSVGLGGGEFHWGIMLPAGSYEGSVIDVVRAYDINAMVGTLAIYNDGATAPANQLSIQDIEFTGAGAWVEFSTGVTVDPTKNVWIVFDAVDGAAYPMGTSNDDNGDANGRWVEINGTWYDMGDVGVTGRANMIRAHFESIDYDDLNWTTVSGVTSPYTIEGLQPETNYIVRVKALCGGEDGESLWTYAYFTTLSACAAPVDLEATDITYNAATLNWLGYQDSFNVRYRTTGYSYPAQNTFFEDFESASLETNGWTVIRNGEGTENTDWRIYDGNFSGGRIYPHSGEYVVMGRSWASSAYDVDNWLITPQVALTGELRYWVLDDGTYHEHYDIYVSTTTADISAFTLLYEPGDASDEWTEHVVDLSSYNGAQGYIAFRLTDEDQDYLFIDDVLIGEMVTVPAGEWINATATEPTLAISGLTPETEYEWQVQGINASCDGGLTEWSEISNFTTLEQTTVTQTIALAEGANYVSFYVDITLNDLKAALVEALPSSTIKIIGQNNSTTYDPVRHRWNGTLQWNEAQMFIIRVTDACEISFESMPLDPAEHSVDIVSGANYIAFPLMEGMSLTDAFAGFAVNGDKVLSQTSSATYNRGRWQGQGLTNLEPGKGYIYISVDSKTLVFPSNAK